MSIKMKMSCAFAAVMAVVVGTGGAAIAQEEADSIVDFNTLTCRDLLLMEGEEESSTLIFLHGYMNGERQKTMVDADELADLTDIVRTTCITTPGQSLIQIFETTYGRQS